MLPRVRFPWITPLITTGHECQGDTTLHHPTCCLYHTWEHHLEYQLSRYSPQPSQPILPPPVPTSTRPSSLKVCGSCQEQQEPWKRLLDAGAERCSQPQDSNTIKPPPMQCWADE
ncbi:hypothetical protein O3P69_003788 [Scylla paramamosain]|uniref:Uncharacterized protein n=1 Tax=Scylla paramamosain TaxID=85552 RepID=A0AAW0UGV8_SCYPA